MKHLVSVLALCLAAVCAVQAKPLRVLAIGNSYTQSLEPELPRLAAAAGVELDLAVFAIGGKSLSNHWGTRPCGRIRSRVAGPTCPRCWPTARGTS